VREQRPLQRAVLDRHEAWVLGAAGRERAVLLDAAGRVVARREGEARQVMWRESELRPLIGRVDVILHNHPGGSSLGEDDLGLALFLNARELIALTRSRTYRLGRATERWPARRDLLGAIADERARLVKEMVAARDAGRIGDDQIERLFYHVLWERVASRFPDRLSYTAERRGSDHDSEEGAPGH
jgi:hypothetical protein